MPKGMYIFRRISLCNIDIVSVNEFNVCQIIRAKAKYSAFALKLSQHFDGFCEGLVSYGKLMIMILRESRSYDTFILHCMRLAHASSISSNVFVHTSQCAIAELRILIIRIDMTFCLRK